MMDWIKNHKFMAGFLGVAVLLAGGYFIFIGVGDTSTDGQQLQREAVEQPTTQGSSELVQLLLEVRDITLNESFFQREAFQTLRSTAQPLPERAVGRRNPFGPLESQEQTSTDGQTQQ